MIHSIRFLVVATFLSFSSCDKSKTPDSALGVEESGGLSDQASSDFVLDAALKEEVAAFGQRFVDAVESRDDDFVFAAMDFKTMIYKGLDETLVSPGFKRSMDAGAKQAGNNALTGLYASRLTLVGVHEFEGKPSLMLRNQPTSGGFDYLQYAVEKNKGDSEWRVVEAYPFSMGIKISELMRSLILPAIQQENKSLFEKLTTKNPVDIEWMLAMPKLQEIMQLARAGKGEDALVIYESLPDRFKVKRFAMLVHIMATGNTENLEGYSQALAAFEEKFPNDPTLSIQGIDANFLKGDYEASRKSLAALQAVVNDDYLDLYDGFIYLAEKNYAEAEKRAKDWLRDHPADAEGLNLLLEVGVAADKHQVSLDAINGLEANHQLDFYQGVLNEPLFAKFKSSSQGQQYLSSKAPE